MGEILTNEELRQVWSHRNSRTRDELLAHCDALLAHGWAANRKIEELEIGLECVKDEHTTLSMEVFGYKDRIAELEAELASTEKERVM